jgi:hypothetical protein
MVEHSPGIHVASSPSNAIAAVTAQMTFGLFVMVVLRLRYFGRLPPFTSRDGFQILLKILKVILCGDFLGFHIIHHLPERDSHLTGSKCQSICFRMASCVSAASAS